jgi:predicted enzyme related to lactoylglutathione lyase
VHTLLTNWHPLTTDLDEAKDLYQIVFSQLLSNQNPSIGKFSQGFKVMVERVKDYAVAN